MLARHHIEQHISKSGTDAVNLVKSRDEAMEEYEMMIGALHVPSFPYEKQGNVTREGCAKITAFLIHSCATVRGASTCFMCKLMLFTETF